MKSNQVTFLAGIGLILPATAGLIFFQSAFVMIPGFFLDSWHLTFGTLVIPTILFFVWNHSLFKGSSAIPKRTYGLYVALVVLSAAWFVATWKDGFQFQGKQYTTTICALNVA